MKRDSSSQILHKQTQTTTLSNNQHSTVSKILSHHLPSTPNDNMTTTTSEAVGHVANLERLFAALQQANVASTTSKSVGCKTLINKTQLSRQIAAKYQAEDVASNTQDVLDDDEQSKCLRSMFYTENNITNNENNCVTNTESSRAADPFTRSSSQRQHEIHSPRNSTQQQQQQYLSKSDSSSKRSGQKLDEPTTKFTGQQPVLLSWLTLLLILMPTFYNDQRLQGTPMLAQAIKLQPDGNKYLWSGESMVVSCRNNNNVKNAKTRWIGPNGHDISEDNSKRIHTASAGTRLVIMNAIAQQDDGQYKCLLGSQGATSGRWEEADFSLKTYKRPSFEGTETRVLMTEELAGQLICRVEFDPAASGPTVTWSRNGTPIDTMHDTAYRIVEYDPATLESKLMIKPVKRQHAGLYTCHAIAETLHLSRPFEQVIEVEVQYQPSFNSTRETVWVERRNQQAPSAKQAGEISSAQQQMSIHQNLGANKRRMMMTTTPSPQQSAVTSGKNSSTVIVELNCTCDSNPPSSIIWSSGSSRLAIMKGTPSHVLEEPTLTKNGTLTTSILVIEYNLDPMWEPKADEYLCSASNTLGSALKRFSIQQGDTSPAFAVGSRIDYNPVTSLMSFVITGPKQTSTNGDNKHQQPDVDAFRIRVDTHGSHHSHNGYNNNNNYGYDGSHNYGSHQQSRSNGVILQLRTNPDTKQIIFPQNVTVSLASLPAGQHKLFLEAHNAVGWSRHRTDLGEFKLVSSSSSSLQLSIANYYMMLISFCLTAFTFSIPISKSSLSLKTYSKHLHSLRVL